MKRVIAVTVVVTLLVLAGLIGAWKALSGDGKASPKLHGRIAFAVLGPAERRGELGARGRDLIDGARMAAAELNAGDGVLGRRLALTVVDDACSADVAYEAAKGIAVDGGFTGVVGGVCDAAAEREVPVIDAAGIPFLVTTANGAGLTSSPLRSTFLMNGTLYQQALSAVFWMNYRHAQRLAIVGDRSPSSRELTKSVIRLIEGAPRLVSLQTLASGRTDMTIPAKAAIASHPNFVLWTGSAAGGGALAGALRENGYTGAFTATAASESPAFLAAAGAGGAKGAFVTATSGPLNTPTAAKWRARFRDTYGREPGLDALQAYDSVRAIAQAVRRAGTTDAAKVTASLGKLPLSFVTSLGVVRFARDHTLLYDNRVILVVKNDRFAWQRSLRTDSLQ